MSKFYILKQTNPDFTLEEVTKKETVREGWKTYLKERMRISFVKLMFFNDLEDINDFKDDDDEEEEVWMECEVCPPL